MSYVLISADHSLVPRSSSWSHHRHDAGLRRHEFVLLPVSPKAGLGRPYLIHSAVLLSGAERLHRLFARAGFKTVSDDSLILRLPDEPGALAKVAEVFKQAGVNIQSLHIIERKAGHTIVALSADDREKAEALVDPATVV